MPRLPEQPIDAIRDLEAQLRFAPREALLRDIERAERLCLSIEPGVKYPEDWVCQAVTGYRAQIVRPRLMEGSELLASMPVLLQRLCEHAGLTEAEVPDSLGLDEISERWRVSRATLSRLRRRGLPTLRVRDGRRSARVVVRREMVEAFERSHEGLDRGAVRSARLSAAETARIVARAARYRRCLGWSLNKAAGRLAGKTGRSREAVRQVLQRAEAERPMFGHAPPLREREGRVLRRARARGVTLQAMVKATRRSPASIRRAINLARAGLLRDLLERGVLETGLVDEGSLRAKPANEGLGGPAPATLEELLRAARARGAAVPFEERVRLSAYQSLRRRAAAGVAGLSRLHPAAAALDRIETDLRWAARLKAELVRSQLRVIVTTIEARVGSPIERTPAGPMVALLGEAIAAASTAVDSIDAARGGRVAAGVGLAVDRVVARRVKAAGGPWSGRAAPMAGGREALGDWTRTLCEWQRWLEPDARVRRVAVAGGPSEADARLLVARFGWGGRPRTLTELCEELDLPENRAPALEQAALCRALDAAR
ncbi:MAG: hypothetical protein DYG92_02890 [Leptolyngbya sp. PLA1]|nr:hypothetical protein [Leptolyngbya sp. PLA1]